ncbi:MAG: hypothetical protein IPG90_04660 [Bacteroidetes bacterium]|jgi:hypothetical protein|nr:hypothetical protein [Bacteroidota bacterium]MBP6403586.1 hypothetical protein [Bacteroidia bacterium]MBK6837640.1 hypothetical protein [Bacteroidota bacterium]MBK9542237.1 hypothetical protein [Bacteroidota bacterium]MBL0257987.1 hypothetical protein [Bacteroidota bacterium]
MKKNILILFFACLSYAASFAQEFKIITIVESIVPGGGGRSRIVENQGTVDINAVTTEREGNKSKANNVDRGDLKEAGENLKETKLLNFYSLVGINFQNIASNDAVIGAKINEMIKNGWQVANITSGVESDAGKDDGNGIFITRIFFVKH